MAEDLEAEKMSKDVSVTEDEHRQVGELRWFAGLAMQAIINKLPSVPASQVEREEVSLQAYRMAQQMVATAKRLDL